LSFLVYTEIGFFVQNRDTEAYSSTGGFFLIDQYREFTDGIYSNKEIKVPFIQCAVILKIQKKEKIR
jgi:hypothetical protein